MVEIGRRQLLQRDMPEKLDRPGRVLAVRRQRRWRMLAALGQGGEPARDEALQIMLLRIADAPSFDLDLHPLGVNARFLLAGVVFCPPLQLRSRPAPTTNSATASSP